MKARRLIGFLFTLALFSCQEVDTREFYDMNDGDNLYSFSVDMTDTLSKYDFSFFTKSVIEDEGFFIDVEWISPSGEKAVERVYFDCLKGPLSPYRVDCVPSENGVWTLNAWTGSEDIFGLGLIVNRHGTR